MVEVRMVFFIENTEQSFLKLDYEIKTFRNEHKKITPEFAKYILSKTNHRANVRYIIKLIGLLDEEERKAFGEFAVCAVDGRAHDATTNESLRNLAIECECVEEFDFANEKRKFYGPEDCMGSVARCSADIQRCIDKGGITVLDIENEVSNLSFKNADLSKIRLNRLLLHPNCTSAFYVSCTNFYKFDIGILSMENSYFNECDLGGGERFSISSKNIRLSKVTNMPKECFLNSGLSGSEINCMCIVDDSDFVGCQSIYVNGFDDFVFSKVGNVSGDVLFSDMNKANIGDCDFCAVKVLNIDKVREYCHISSVKLPRTVQIKDVKEIYFSDVDFENVENMTFERVDKIGFKGGKLPRKLDVSKIREVDFRDINISGADEIVFRDIAQKNRALFGRKYSGKIKYTSLLGLGIGGKEM
jgi:uncharacterized protein YjbI with pentapeptide repeats